MTLTASPATRAADADPIRVIFADDSAAMRTLARFALSTRAGFDLVGEACDGAEALSLVDRHDADCVILDVEMPNVGGFEALAQLQRSRPSLPVVMLSGYADAVVTRRAETEGAAAYLEKNNCLAQLAETVRRVTLANASTRGAVDPSGAAQVGTSPAVQVDTSPVEQVNPAPVAPVGLAVPDATAVPDAPESNSAPDAPSAEVAAADLLRLEYVISHDFAEPARILSGFSKLLAQRYADQLDDSGRLFVDNIQSAAARLQQMIDDLLAYSRAGRLDPTLEPVDVVALVQQTYLKLASQHPAARLGVAALPQVIGSASLLGTVLTCLVRNALLFNASPDPTVHVAGRATDGRAVITVTDNGIGMTAAQCDSVFDLFRRLNTREEYAGTGTGLTLCRRLMTLQHGTINLDSTSGNGTVVTLTLPLSEPSAHPTPLLENGDPS